MIAPAQRLASALQGAIGNGREKSRQLGDSTLYRFWVRTWRRCFGVSDFGVCRS